MQQTENTKKAIENLSELTDKPIILTTLEEEARATNLPYIVNFLGATREEEGGFIIALNDKEPDTHESTFVHEVTHIIIRYLRYPEIMLDEAYVHKYIPSIHHPLISHVISSFTSCIEHPEVYRQMSINYDLDMEAYFQTLFKRKLQLLDSFTYSSLLERVFLTQQTILDCIEYHYYSQTVKNDIFRKVEEVSPDAYQIACQLIDGLADNWSHSPEAFTEAARFILNRVIQVGEENGMSPGDNLYKALQIEPRYDSR
jgi:hypothetical protein